LDETFKLAVNMLVDPRRKLRPEAVGDSPRKARLVFDGAPAEPPAAFRQRVVDSGKGLDKGLAGIDSTTRNVTNLSQAGELHRASPLADPDTPRPPQPYSHTPTGIT
jgi:hypothetical protein